MTISYPEFKNDAPTGVTVTGPVESIEVVSLGGHRVITLQGGNSESFSDDDEVAIVDYGTVFPCIGDDCHKPVEFEGALAFDETSHACPDHRNDPKFIDGITWKIGEDSPRIPSLDDDEL
jgi:hypothetical protein